MSSNNPSVQTLVLASNAVYYIDTPGVADANRLTLFLDSDGKPMEDIEPDGMVAAAYQDELGNVIIAYQGTISLSQMLGPDLTIEKGQIPAQTFQEAKDFAREVEDQANTDKVPATQIFVTGHSLGGDEAEYVARQLSLSGATFGATGLPGYNGSDNSSGLTDYVNYGDPVGNYGSDTEDAPIAPKVMLHYGVVQYEGNPSDGDGLDATATLLANSGVTMQDASYALSVLAFDTMSQHLLKTYATDFGVTLPPQTKSSDELQFDSLISLITPLGGKGAEDLSGATVDSDSSVVSPGFTVSAESNGTFTITQNHKLGVFESSAFNGSIKTVVKIDPNTGNVTSISDVNASGMTMDELTENNSAGTSVLTDYAGVTPGVSSVVIDFNGLGVESAESSYLVDAEAGYGTLLIGGQGDNTFNIKGGTSLYDPTESGKPPDIIWGGGGHSNYNFTGLNDIVFLNIPNATASEIESLSLNDLEDMIAGPQRLDYLESSSIGFGPLTIIIDPQADDVFKLGSTVISGGSFDLSKSESTLYLFTSWDASGQPLTQTSFTSRLPYDVYDSGVDFEGSEEVNGWDGNTYLHVAVTKGDDTLRFLNFDNGTGGISLQGGNTSVNTQITLAVAGQDGSETATASTPLLMGGGHNVTYVVNDAANSDGTASPASVTISNEHAGTSDTPIGILAFGRGIESDDILVAASPTSSQDLAFRDGTTGQLVEVLGGLNPSSNGLADVTFADGTSWSYADVLAMLESPTIGGAATGSIVGDTTANVLDSQGVVGTDIGNGGGDTFIFNSGFGQLQIEEQDANASDVNTLQLGTGISPSQAVLSSDGTNVYLSLGGNDKVTLDDMALGGGNGIEQITFADGTVLNEAEIASILATGTTGNDQLYGVTTGLTFDGKGGSDYEQGLGGGDTFVFDSGYGQLEVNEQDPGAAPDNTLQLGAGIVPSQVTLSVTGSSVTVSDGISGDQVTLDGMISSADAGIQQIAFADGTTWSHSEIASILSTGTTGDDRLYGIEPGETFDGKGGSDYEQGQGGGDTFIFDPGYGQLEINEFVWGGGGPDNTLQLGAGIDPSQLVVKDNYYNITIADGISGDAITLDGMPSNSWAGIQQIVFANGTVWNQTEIYNQVTIGTTGNDRLYGIIAGKIFDGRGGSDYEQGLGGGDTFIFNPGYGQLEINEHDSSAVPHNTLQLGGGIDPSQVKLSDTANNVYISDGIAGDEVILDGMMSSAANGVQQITFADGTTWNRAEIASILATGTTGNDQLYGLAAGLTFDGKGGSDYAQGLGGGDTFIFNPGYGQLEINEHDSSADPDNTLALGSGIDPSQVTLTETASAVYLSDGIASDEVTIDGMSQSMADGMQQITFANGTIWSRAEIASMLATGTTGDDQLYGVAPGQTFDGKGGSDYEQGLGGGDTFIFGSGYGQLTISENDISENPNDTLEFGAGIDRSRVTVSENYSGLTITDGVSGDSVSVLGNPANPQAGVQEVVFADGTVWKRIDLLNEITTGTTGSDRLYGVVDGQTFDGKGGSDFEQGQGGGDTFIFGPGYGQLEIVEAQYNSDLNNTLVLGAGIDPSQVVLTETATSVFLSDGIAGDEVTLDYMAYAASYGVQQIAFADGTTWSRAEIGSMLATGTTGNDQLFGVAPGLTFDGKGGSDYEQGQGGGDTFIFDPGYGQLEIVEQDGRSANPDNTLALGAGIDPSQIVLTGTGTKFFLSDGIAGDGVTLDYMGWGASYGVQQIAFADGTTWSRAEIASKLATGTTGNDQLFGISPGLTFDGKGGSDYEQGQGGGDTFIFDPGYGQLEIAEQDGPSANSYNTLALGAGIDPSQVTLSATAGGVTVSDGISGDQVTLDSMTSSTHLGIQKIAFADGTTWSRSEIASILATGTTGNDQLYGVTRGLTFDGKGGSDYEQGQGGGDTFVFDPSYGQLEINEQDPGAASDNTLQLGASIDPSQVTLSATASGVIVSDGISGDQVTLDGMTSSTSAGIQQIAFANGVTWSRAEMVTMLTTGTTGNDQLYGVTTGLTFDGKGGSDYEQSQGGGNTFIFDSGYGHLEINEQSPGYGQSNTLKLGTGLTQSDITLQAEDSTGDLTILDGTTGDSIVIDDDLYNDWGVNSRIPNITFSDGSTLSLSQSLTFTWSGTASETGLTGSGYGANVFNLAPGGDSVTFGNGSQGGSNWNTVNYASGDGAVTINPNGGAGSIVMAADVTQGDITLQADNSTGNLTILDGNTGDSIVIDNDLYNNWGVHSQIGNITFSDGSTLDLTQPLTFTWSGTASKTNLTGSGYGANVFNLAPGGDSVTFGNGSQGGANSNLVNYTASDGAVTINLNGGAGSIAMAAGITQSDITLQADDSTGTLTILDGITGDSIVIDNDLYNNWGVHSQIGNITFSDGSTLDLGYNPQPLTFTWSGTASETSLTGSGYGANLFDLAPGGDSLTFGNGSQGGSNWNTVNFAAGDGAITIGTNGGTGSIAMAAGISQGDLALRTDSAGDLTVFVGSTGDSLTIASDLTNSGSRSTISQISFSDGTVVTGSQLVDLASLSTAYQAAAGDVADLPTLSLMDTAYLSGASVGQIDAAITSAFSGSGPSIPSVSPVVDEQPVALGNTLLPFATTTLADSNSQQVDIATVTLSAGAGSLSSLGSGILTNGGLTYIASGSAAAVQADLQKLTLTPSAGAAGSTSSLDLTVSNLSGGSVSTSINVPVQAAGSASGMAFIYGSAANNALSATGSPDQFVFADLDMGAASISGFDPSADVLQLSRSQFASFSALQNSLRDTSGGATILIDQNNSILLKNVTVASLHASDFRFA